MFVFLSIKDLLVLRGKQVDGPVFPRPAPVWAIHLNHLLDPKTQALQKEHNGNESVKLAHNCTQPKTMINYSANTITGNFIPTNMSFSYTVHSINFYTKVKQSGSLLQTQLFIHTVPIKI